MPTQKGAIRTLVDAKVQEASGNKRVGYKKAAEKLDSLMKAGKLQPGDFSLRQLFEELVDPTDMSDVVAIAEAVNTSAFPTVAAKIIHKDILDEYNLALGDAEQLVRRSDPTNRTDEELVVGFEAGDTEPLLRRQGMAYEETDFGEKNWKLKMSDFGRIISLTRETIFEDRTGEVLSRARDIGRAAGHQQQKVIIQTIEGNPRTAFQETAFGGAIYKGQTLTQAQLYSTNHSALDGQVNKNLIASNGLADWTNIDAIHQEFANMTNEAGDKISIVPTTLLVPFALKATAFQIINSTMVQAVGDTDARNLPTINPLKDMGSLRIMSSVFMESATTYFAGDFPKQLLLLDVFRPETASQGTTSELAFSNQIIARFRFSYHYGIGHTDWRYIVKNTA